MSNQKENIVIVESMNPLEFSFSKQSSKKIIHSTPSTSSKHTRSYSIQHNRLNSLKRVLPFTHQKITKPYHDRPRYITQLLDPENRHLTRSKILSPLSRQSVANHHKQMAKLNNILSKISSQLEKTSSFLTKYKL